MTLPKNNSVNLTNAYFIADVRVFACPFKTTPPQRSIVVRASARGAGGRGSIPDRVTPKT